MKAMDINGIYITRYLFIPLGGFFTGLVVFLLGRKNLTTDAVERLQEWGGKRAGGAGGSGGTGGSGGAARRLFLCFLLVYSLYFFSTITLRYFTGHTAFFDFGIYDWRLWLIYSVPWADWPGKVASALDGHFQPVLVLYSALYDMGVEPVALNLLQAAAVLSGTVPIYLMAKERLKDGILTFSVTALYLLYPATQFNMAIDFHPDHLIIPVLLWSYYFIEKGFYGWLVVSALSGFVIKEPLVLATGFLGLYMAFGKRRYAQGLALLAVSLAVFFMSAFFISSSIETYQAHESISGEVAYGYLFAPGGLTTLFKEVLSPEKWRFPVFLLLPLLFIPLLRPWVFIPAVPLIAVQLLSTIDHHQNVASQYTAGIIPPVFASFVYGVEYLNKRFGYRVTVAALSWVAVLLLSYNVAHSPNPLAVGFWNSGWSHGRWHYANYFFNRSAELDRAIALVPEEPTVKVVTHSMIYDKRLSHRYFFKSFPERWREADFILLDNTLGPYVADGMDERMYAENLRELEEDGSFSRVYGDGGVLLFRRTEAIAGKNPYN